MRTLFLLLLAALLSVPTAAGAETGEYTLIALRNGTAHFIYVDTYEHHGSLFHWGMVAPNGIVALEMKMPHMKFFTDVYVYVKKGESSRSEDTICTVTKTFGNNTGQPWLHEHVHFNGKTCSIDPA